MTMQKILDRAGQLLTPDSSERNERLERFVVAEQKRSAATGQTGAGIIHIRDYCARDLADRAETIFNTLTRVHKTLAPPWTEDAATQLKDFAIVYLNDARLHLQEVVRREYQRVTGRSAIVGKINLDILHSRELERLNANIDLHIDAYAHQTARDLMTPANSQKSVPAVFVDTA